MNSAPQKYSSEDINILQQNSSAYRDDDDSASSASESLDSHSSSSQRPRVKRRGRKPSKVDMKGRLEKSRQSARECRARKKLRYQYVEELVADRERAIFALRDELELFRKRCLKIDQGQIPNEVKKMVESSNARVSQFPAKSATRNEIDN